MRPEEKKRSLELAGYRMDIAREDLQVAGENMAAGHLRAANNRAYLPLDNGSAGTGRNRI